MVEVAFESPMVNYRAFRLPWEGRPTTRPAVVAEREGNEVAVYTSWNGATEVASWRVEARRRASLTTVATAPRSGFETRIALSGPAEGTCYFRTTALDANGAVLGQPAVAYAAAPGCLAAQPQYVYLPSMTHN